MAFVQTLKSLLNHPLNQNDKLGALSRYVRWQLGVRLVANPVIIDFANGSRLIARHGVSSAIENHYSGLNEFKDMSFLLHFLRPDDLFFDVGANIGSFTVLASAAIGARSVSFEPLPPIFEQLKENVSLNSIGNRVTAKNLALGKAAGSVSFTSHMEAGNHVATEQDRARGDTIDIAIAKLDEIALDQIPTLIKIDVEGFEAEVVAGAEATLNNPALLALIVETNGSGARYGVDEQDLYQRIVSQGFTAVDYDPLERRLSPLSRANHLGNTLYVRSLNQANARVKNAPAYSVNGMTV